MIAPNKTWLLLLFIITQFDEKVRKKKELLLYKRAYYDNDLDLEAGPAHAVLHVLDLF